MANPLFIKSASIEVDGVEMGELISNVVLTPTTSTLTFKGVSGATFQSVGSEVWTLQFDYAQDWSTADSLALKLFNETGTNVTVTVNPEGTVGAPSFTAEVTLLSGSVGGATDSVATASVTLPVTGRPVLAPAV